MGWVAARGPPKFPDTLDIRPAPVLRGAQYRFRKILRSGCPSPSGGPGVAPDGRFLMIIVFWPLPAPSRGGRKLYCKGTRCHFGLSSFAPARRAQLALVVDHCLCWHDMVEDEFFVCRSLAMTCLTLAGKECLFEASPDVTVPQFSAAVATRLGMACVLVRLCGSCEWRHEVA